jgi:hypothetical protein
MKSRCKFKEKREEILNLTNDPASSRKRRKNWRQSQ